MSGEVALVVMRLIDMRRIHPGQDNTRVCSKCGFQVGIYPSGQAALKANPGAVIICALCASPQESDEAQPAGSWPEIAQEVRDSQDVGKA